MIFAAALVALHVAIFAWAAVDDSAATAALPMAECLMALLALALPATRSVLLTALMRYWPAALAFAILIGMSIYDVAAGSDLRSDHIRRDEAWRLVGFAMGALSAAAAALSAGRRQMYGAVLLGAVALGALAVIQEMQTGRALFEGAEATGAFFVLLIAFSAYAAIDALGVRTTRNKEHRTTRAERLLLPTVALLTSLIAVTRTGSVATATALGFAIAALAGVLALRERRRGMGTILLGATCAISLAGATTLFALTRHADENPFASQIQISVAAVAAVAAWLAFLLSLALSPDRRRRPSRGLAIALSGCAVLTFATAGSAPQPFAMLALLIGIAGAQVDELAVVSSELRSSDQP